MSDQQPKWAIAQEEPGTTNHVWWSIIDTHHRFIRARAFGFDLATSLVDALNGATYAIETTSKGLDLEVAQRLVDEIEASAPRDCGHQNDGDGRAKPSCDVCMRWSQAQADTVAIRRHLGL